MAGVALGIQADRLGTALDDARDGYVRESPRLHTRWNLSSKRNSGPSAMRAVSSQAWTERTGQLFSVDPKGMPMRRPSPSWSFLARRRVTTRPALENSRSAKSSPTSSERRKPPAKPRSSRARMTMHLQSAQASRFLFGDSPFLGKDEAGRDLIEFEFAVKTACKIWLNWSGDEPPTMELPGGRRGTPVLVNPLQAKMAEMRKRMHERKRRPPLPLAPLVAVDAAARCVELGLENGRRGPPGTGETGTIDNKASRQLGRIQPPGSGQRQAMGDVQVQKTAPGTRDSRLQAGQRRPTHPTLRQVTQSMLSEASRVRVAPSIPGTEFKRPSISYTCPNAGL